MDLVNLLKGLADRALGWVLIGLGGLFLLLGYLGVRGTAYVVEQLPYVISGGLGGLFLLGLGTMLLLSADLRDQWRALLDIRDELSAARGTELLPAVEPEPLVEVRPRRTRR